MRTLIRLPHRFDSAGRFVRAAMLAGFLVAWGMGTAVAGNEGPDGVSTEAEFVLVLRREPWNRVAVERFADWLADRDSDRARMIRLDINDARTADEQQELWMLKNKFLEKHREEFSPFQTVIVRCGLVDTIVLDTLTDDLALRLLEWPSLRQISAEFSELTARGFLTLARLPHLEGLDLQKGGLDDPSVQILATFPPHVRLHFDNVSAWNSLDWHGDFPDPLPTIQAWRLSQLKTLSPDERSSTAVRYLSGYSQRAPGSPLKHCWLEDASDEEMPFVAEVPTLTSLSLSGNDLTDAGFASLRSLPHLETLSLHSTRIQSFEPIRGLPCLRSLSFDDWGEPFDERGLEALASFPKLEELRLNFASQQFVANEVLSQLASLKTLKRLDLTLSPFHESTTLRPLSDLHALEFLSIRGGGFAAKEMRWLRDLKELQTLELELGSSENDGHDFDIPATLPKLRNLTLGGHGVTDAAMSRLAAAPALHTLVIPRALVTNEAANTLAATRPGLIVFDGETVFRAPRERYELRRCDLGGGISMLVPTDWTRPWPAQQFPVQELFSVCEDGWEDMGQRGKPAAISVIRRTPSEIATTTSLTAWHGEVERVAIDGHEVTRGVVGENQYVVMMPRPEGVDMLTMTVEATRFASFLPLFRHLAGSVHLVPAPADEETFVVTPSINAAD